MKLLIVIIASLGMAAAKMPTAGLFLAGDCDKNDDIKATAKKHGEHPITCAVVNDVTVVTSTLIEPAQYGNDQAKLTGKGALADRAKEDPNDPSKGKPSVMIDIPEAASVCGIILGGRTDYDNDYAGEFKVESSADGTNWFEARTEEGGQVFAGCEKGSETVVNFFLFPIIGKQIKLTATKIMPGAAASFRVAPVVNCTYKNTFDLGNTCGEDMNQAKFEAIPNCEKIRLICRAGTCEMPRMSWGDDPFVFDSPCCYNAQLEFTSLGDGHFVAWKIPGQRTFGMLFRNGLTSTSFNSKVDYKAYTFQYGKYAEACGKTKK